MKSRFKYLVKEGIAWRCYEPAWYVYAWIEVNDTKIDDLFYTNIGLKQYSSPRKLLREARLAVIYRYRQWREEQRQKAVEQTAEQAVVALANSASDTYSICCKLWA